MRVLVTGATGFIGGAVVRAALARGDTVRAAVRTSSANLPPGVEIVPVGDIGPHTDWAEALQDADAVIHLAARVHVMQETADDPQAAFDAVNVHGTARLLEACTSAGVKRFVFASSIKVNGEATDATTPAFDATLPANPQDPYGRSKYAAEQLANHAPLTTTNVRLPLVYGPGVKGNFSALFKLVARGLPLPFGAIDNRRSLLGVRNAADFLLRCTTHPGAANETFVLADGDDLSTAELIRRIATALDTRALLVPIPPGMLRAGLSVLGRGAAADRLLGSLVVDASRARAALNWTPPVTMADELQATAAWLRAGPA